MSTHNSHKMVNLEMLEPNKQPIEKRSEQTDGSLDVFEVFSTIQGEGPFAGRPAVFVRLAGCNLQCPACDTDYTSKRAKVSAYDLLQEVKALLRSYIWNCHPTFVPLVVITGGEPFRQPLGTFVSALVASNIQVQIETNGTLYDSTMESGDLKSKVMVVCSPKTSKLDREAMVGITHLKYVMRAGEVNPKDGLPTSALMSAGEPARPWPGFTGSIYLQPCDEKDPALNKANTEACVASCMKHGYILCLQVHKIVNLP